MNIINDLSNVTTIPVLTLERLVEKEQMCILHQVLENELEGNPTTVIEVGLGTLYINHENENIKYKFIPSKNFEKKLKTTILTKESPLVYSVEEALKDKIENVYKDLF